MFEPPPDVAVAAALAMRAFRGIVTLGPLGADGVCAAAEMLARHDENYRPMEVAGARKAVPEGGTMRSHEPQP